MKRILGITTAALMSASVLAAPAFAQADQAVGEGTDEYTITPNVDEGAAGGEFTTMPEADIDTDTTAAIPEFDGAVSAIQGGTASAATIGALGEVDSVNVVRVDSLRGYDPAALDAALMDGNAGIMELQASIDANPTLSEQLRMQGVDSSDVVAAQVAADGGVLVYVR